MVEQFAAGRRDATRAKSAHKSSGVHSHSSSETSLPEQLAVVTNDKLDGMLALTKTLHILLCLEDQYIIRFTDVSTRPVNLHNQEST